MRENLLTASNYSYSYLEFGDRQAGVGVGYCPNEESYFYNAYCVDRRSLKDLFAVEHTFLEEALETINSEFITWKLVELKESSSGCGSCAAR